MLGFKRIAITKSFEITQIRVILQCMIRTIKFLSQTIEYDSEYNDSIYADYLKDEYIYCCNIAFWVCISCIQTGIISASNRSVKSIITIGLANLVSLLQEKNFRKFLCDTEKFSKNFQNYSVFVNERRSNRNSALSSQNGFEGNYLCLYDILFKCIVDSEKGEFLSEIEMLLDLNIKDKSLINYDDTDNSFIKFMVLIFFKMIKMEQLESSTEISEKQKYSTSLSIIQKLNDHLPEIDEFQSHEINQCLEDLNEILSNFYEGDEYPFSAICELLQNLTHQIAKYLISNGYKVLLNRIQHIIESLVSSVGAENTCYVDLIESIKVPFDILVKRQSAQDQFPNPKLGKALYDLEEEKREIEEAKDIDTKSDSPAKATEPSILKSFKDYYNKNRILGERMSLLPIIIVPVYLGIRKIITQERVLIDQQKNGQIFGPETSLFGKLTYINFFCGQDSDDTENEFDDIQTLFKSTQMIVERIKNTSNPKRRSYAVRMSDSKKRRGKNPSNESPPFKEEGLKIPKLIKIKRKSNAMKIKSEILNSNSNKASDPMGRISLGTSDFDEDYSSILNSLKKKRKNF